MTKDMTTGSIPPLLVNFTIPLVLGNLFQLTYNAVDSIIVGKFVGEDAGHPLHQRHVPRCGHPRQYRLRRR